MTDIGRTIYLAVGAIAAETTPETPGETTEDPHGETTADPTRQDDN